jgi:hypothetical protein
VTIVGNWAQNYGGGMYLNSSNPTFTHVTITDNTAVYYGAGMYLSSSDPILTHVTIVNNTAESYVGGGMMVYFSNPMLNHVTISNNIGGGMRLYYSDPNLTHVTISNNTANSGGGMRLYDSNPILTNSIIWGNIPESIYIYSEEEPIITYSDIEGGWEGEENINSDPMFTDPENDDYTLQEGSPCIDSGIVMEDMEYCGSAPDMGAYEYCEECGAELADVNGDSEINILDLVQIANLILETSTPAYECAADYNGDGEVNILDLVQIANYILDN